MLKKILSNTIVLLIRSIKGKRKKLPRPYKNKLP